MMTIARFWSVVVLVNLLTVIPKGCIETIPKAVCVDEPVQLFQNISLFNRTTVVNHISDNEKSQIALWFTKDSLIHSRFDERYQRTLYLDHNGTLWMRHVQMFDEGKYNLLVTEGVRVVSLQEVEITVMVAPSMECKPKIEIQENYLFAFLDISACGKPPVSAYWLGFDNQVYINLQPRNVSHPFHACALGPALRCVKSFKAIDFCSSFRGGVDAKLQPKISISKTSVLESSINLQCQLNGKSAGTFRFRRNGILINSNSKYSQTERCLIIYHPNIDDTYDIYTCMESESRVESDPYSIETSGPYEIQFKQTIGMVKEMDTLNVSCVAICYPLCSVSWSKLDPVSGNRIFLLSNDVLSLVNVTRKMSGNYSCRVKNLITGAFVEESLSLDILYGPEKIYLNTSTTIVELHEFDSIGIRCRAVCFPSCLITWTEGNVNNQLDDAVLSLINVSSNGTYTCHASNPRLDSPIMSQSINITVKIDETKIPRIDIFISNVSESYIVLQCHSSRMSKGKFSWMINGSLVKHSDKYTPDNAFLYVRHLTVQDQTSVYTCKEPGTNFHSNPFNIHSAGPTNIKFNPKEVVVIEYDDVYVRCVSDCKPLCSFQWFRMDSSSLRKNFYLEGNVLNVTDIKREMSGIYSCQVHNILSGKNTESFLSLDVIYGPDKIVLNTSSNVTEVDEFKSMTVKCTANCFPPCLISWSEKYNETTLQHDSDLKLVNVTEDGVYTCHATNPRIVNSTILANIDVKVKYDAKQRPRIVLSNYNASSSTIVLECRSSRKYAGRFSWRVKGSVIMNSDKYLVDNQFLVVRQLSSDDQYNAYICIELGSGFQSDQYPTKTYGPDAVIITTAENKTKVFQSSSTTIFCYADCFPPCQFTWTFSNSEHVTEGPLLNLANVTSNGSITCHATNPLNKNATLSASIDIKDKSEDESHNVFANDTDQDRIATPDFPLPYLLHLVPVTGGLGVIVAIVCCWRKKCVPCSSTAREPINTTNANSDVGQANPEETLSHDYWTVVTNIRGEFRTAVENYNNEGVIQIIDSSSNSPKSHSSEEHETYSNSFNSDPVKTESNGSDSIKSEGYLNPIHSHFTQLNDINTILSHSTESTEYIHPVSSDTFKLDVYTHPSPLNE